MDSLLIFSMQKQRQRHRGGAPEVHVLLSTLCQSLLGCFIIIIAT